MRINVYSQELTSEAHLIGKESNTGVVYHAVQLMLHSSPMLHHPPADDDRSAVTFWLPKSPYRRDQLAETFRRMADLVQSAPAETGLD
jgi:hypothetical protein